jgi:hypothetical protein
MQRRFSEYPTRFRLRSRVQQPKTYFFPTEARGSDQRRVTRRWKCSALLYGNEEGTTKRLETLHKAVAALHEFYG